MAVRNVLPAPPPTNSSRLPESIPAAPPFPPPANVPAAGGPGACDGRLVDLPTALRLAGGTNPRIALARQAIVESLALQQGARALLLPTLTAGSNYHLHHGNLQRSAGAILALSEQALYFGGGARALAAESVAFPAVRVFSHLGDALFEPLAARQRTASRRFDSDATFNTILLEVSTRYLDLMAAEAQIEILRRSQADVGEVVRVTAHFSETGQGREADADRARTEAGLIDLELKRAEERLAVAAAELARVLNLDPSVRLKTVGGPIPVLELVDRRNTLEQLVEIAVRRRPEIAARNAEIAESETRARQEQTRPLLPTISVGYSAAGFGGGSDLVVPTFGRFNSRADFDVFAVWTLQNFGAGNAARTRGRRTQVNEALSVRTRTVNLVRREVAEAYAAAEAARQQLPIFEGRLTAAEDGLREELARIRAGAGRPIELLDNLSRAVAARLALLAGIIAYDEAQFCLFVALGQPPTCALPRFGSLTMSPPP